MNRFERNIRKMTNKKEKFIPILIGTDLNTYTMSVSFHEEYGIKPIVVGRAPLPFTEGSSIISEFYYTSRIDEDDFLVDYLKNLAKKYHSKYENLLLIGTNDKYVTFIINNAKALSSDFKFSNVDKEWVPKLFLKKNFYQLCAQYGLDTPLTFYYSCESDTPFNEEVPFPLIIKPSNGIQYYNHPFEGMQKVYLVQNYEELHQVINKIKASGYRDELILQDYIPGDDTNMWDSVYYGNRKGKPQLISLGQVVLQEPTTTGVGNYTAIIVRGSKKESYKKIMDKLVYFMEQIGYKGFANFDLKYDERDGTFKVFEVNLRQGRSSYYLTQCGYNIAKTIVDDVIEHKEKDFEYVEGEDLFAVVPKQVVKKYTKDPEIQEEVTDLIARGKYNSPIFYKGDKGMRRRLFMLLRQINYFRKYRNNPIKQ